MPVFRSTTFTYFSAKGAGPHESYAPGAARAVVPIDIIYVEGVGYGASQASRFQAAADILGYQSVATTPSGGKYLTRTTPMPLPQAPAPIGGIVPSRPLYASTLSDGLGLGAGTFNTGDGGNDYDAYRYNLTGVPRAYQIREDSEVLGEPAIPLGSNGSPTVGYADEGHTLAVHGWKATRYITKIIRAGKRDLGLRPGMIRFTSDALPMLQTAPYREVVSRVRYIWHLVPLAAIPMKAITVALSRVNEFVFDGFATQTLLLTHWEYDIQPGPLGDLLATVIYDFLWKPALDTQDASIQHGHNAFIRAMKVTNPSPPPPTKTILNYDYVSSDGTENGTPLYLLAPFDTLFRPDQP